MIDTSRPKKFHLNCLLCGNQNSWSQGMQFYAADDGWVYGSFQSNAKLQGYDGIMHGGVITALLDAVMTNCLFYHDIQAVTADLQVRFLRPVPCDSMVNLRARVLSTRSILHHVKAELMCEKQIMARAEARFMQQRPSSAGGV